MGGTAYRVIVAYANYRVGDVVHPPGVLADVLRMRGFIVRDDEEEEAGGRRPEAPGSDLQPPASSLQPKRKKSK